MPPVYVKPYVKRNKNDMADAEAICEAVYRPQLMGHRVEAYAAARRVEVGSGGMRPGT